jgi:hypothetical protein
MALRLTMRWAVNPGLGVGRAGERAGRGQRRAWFGRKLRRTISVQGRTLAAGTVPTWSRSGGGHRDDRGGQAVDGHAVDSVNVAGAEASVAASLAGGRRKALTWSLGHQPQGGFARIRSKPSSRRSISARGRLRWRARQASRAAGGALASGGGRGCGRGPADRGTSMRFPSKSRATVVAPISRTRPRATPDGHDPRAPSRREDRNSRHLGRS